MVLLAWRLTAALRVSSLPSSLCVLPVPLPSASGDHLYRMDYKEFVRKHRESGAAITIAALPCDEARATAFGLMKIDEEGRVTEFAEKPKGDALKSMRVDTTVLGVDEKTCAGGQRAGQRTAQPGGLDAGGLAC